jgi:hypothetical protein|tara:strand:- start:437 stop:643 length:207 start_codon:yes stop_codon:yes gene_type:complete
MDGPSFIYCQKIGGYFLIIEKRIQEEEFADMVREMNDESHFRYDEAINIEKKCLTEALEYIKLKTVRR